MTHAQKWRTIPGFPGYEVSDLGNVRNTKYSRELTQHVAARGAGFYVHLGKSTRLIHKLVLLAFEGPGHQRITHRNGNKRDNRLSNLSYGAKNRTPVGSRCSRGHELVGDNVIVWSGSNRICRACQSGVPANRTLPEVLK